jgi:ComF family protein
MNSITLQLNKLFSFLLPKICPGCNKAIDAPAKYICDSCISKIRSVSCERLEHEYKRDFLSDQYIRAFSALFIFEKEKELQSIIHTLKYRNKFLIGIELGKMLAERRGSEISGWNIDVVVPIPLHRIKQNERGYNQSYYLSKGLSGKTGLKINTKVIKRIKYTESQTKIKRADRKKNIRNAFKVIKKTDIKGLNILLVDDLITTGSTANECAKKLLQAGAASVYLAAIALAD